MKNEFELTEAIRNDIFSPFKGMDDEYVKIVRKYHDVFLNNDYKTEYKTRVRAESVDKIKLLVKERVDQAKERVEKVKDQYTVKPVEKKYTIEEKTYNITFWLSIFPTSTIEELKELYANNGVNEDFLKLLMAELRKRDSMGDLDAQVLLLKIQNGDGSNRFKDLDILVKGFDFWASMSNYPAGIINGLENVRYRTISKDLDSYPINSGSIYRPVFKL